MLPTQTNSPETPETNEGAIDTNDSVALFDNFLKKQDAPADVEPEQADEETTEAPEPEETDEADDADADPSDEGEEDEDEEPVKIELKHNGKTIEKTLDEIKDLAQQGFDYSQKMQRVNADREAVSSERQAVEAQKTHLIEQQNAYVETMQVMEAFLSHAGISDEALDKLLQEGDNDGYLRLKNQREKDTRNLANIQAAIKAEQEKAQQRDRAFIIEQQQKGKETLREKMPHLLEEKGAAELRSYLSNMGYTPDQIASTYDANLFIMADKARAYDALMAKTAKPTPVQKPLSKPVKNKAAPAPAQAAHKAQYKQTLEKVKSGDRDAAIEAFKFFV